MADFEISYVHMIKQPVWVIPVLFPSLTLADNIQIGHNHLGLCVLATLT
jgi:hypothetical protein